MYEEFNDYSLVQKKIKRTEFKRNSFLSRVNFYRLKAFLNSFFFLSVTRQTSPTASLSSWNLYCPRKIIGRASECRCHWYHVKLITCTCTYATRRKIYQRERGFVSMFHTTETISLRSNVSNI